MWLAAWRGKRAGKIFFLTRFLPLFLDARPQLNLIRILRPRRTTRQQNSADNRDGKQDGPHVRDDAIRQPDFNHKRTTIVTLAPTTNAFWNPPSTDRSTHFLQRQIAFDRGACREGRAANRLHTRQEPPGLGR